MASSKIVTLLLLALVTAAAAAPVAERALPEDAPYTQPSSVYESAITCPNGIQKKAGGIVFLVHGTGSRGNESWGSGPYSAYLPTTGPGYDICWVDLPSRSLCDAQLSAEYVAYGISYLAAQSATKKVNIIGHSQGAGINPQWALVFWPSKRALVANYIGLAPDYKGTGEGTLLCAGEKAIGGCQPSLWQQSVPSRYLNAQNSHHDANSGAQALVPTLAVYTIEDDVIQPENPPALATSNLPGASVIALQDTRACGLLHLSDHFTMIVDPAAFGLAVAALQYGAGNAVARFNHAFCSGFVDNTLLDFSKTPGLISAVLLDVLSIATYPRTPSEPKLQPVACQRGYAAASDCLASPGYPNNYIK